MWHPLPQAPVSARGAQKKPARWKGPVLILPGPGQELPGKSQEQGEGVKPQPGSLGQGKGWERSMQEQGHAWAQLNSCPSHVGESMALAQRLVLLGVECLPFQIGLADLGRRTQAVRRAEPASNIPSHAEP